MKSSEKLVTELTTASEEWGSRSRAGGSRQHDDLRARVTNAERNLVRRMEKDRARIEELESDMYRIYREIALLAERNASANLAGMINAIGDFSAHALKKDCYTPRERRSPPRAKASTGWGRG